MIAIAGMHRSGTSCITGLLEKCGYSVGTGKWRLSMKDPVMGVVSGQEYNWMLNLNKSMPDNEKGHYENAMALVINHSVLTKAGGEWYQLPPDAKLKETGEYYSPYYEEFSRQFNGDIFKDPRISVTISLWEKYCPKLEKVILCLRNPLGVAQSLAKRDNMSVDAGLILWCEYNLRLIQGVNNLKIAVIDYDNFQHDMEGEFWRLLQTLGAPVSREEMKEKTRGFYEPRLNHQKETDSESQKIPDGINRLYDMLRSRKFPGAL